MLLPPATARSMGYPCCKCRKRLVIDNKAKSSTVLEKQADDETNGEIREKAVSCRHSKTKCEQCRTIRKSCKAVSSICAPEVHL